MHGSEFRAIRQQLGLTKNQFAKMLGYTGNSTNNTTQIRKYENEKKQIPLYIARFAWLIGALHRGRNPDLDIQFKDSIPVWPDWPGYVFQSEADAPQEEVDDNG